MKHLDIKINNHNQFDIYLLIDNQIYFNDKKNKFGNRVISIDTEKDEVDIKVKTISEFNSNWWFLFKTIYFFISVLGIFDIKEKNKKGYNLVCDFKVKLKEEPSTLNLSYNKFEEGIPALLFDGDCDYEPIENKYFIDKKLKRRYALNKWLRFAFWICLIAGFVLVVALS